MKRVATAVAVGVLGVSLAGCDYVPQDDHDMLVDSLTDWSASVYDWQQRTYQTICEIAVVVDPDQNGDFTDIGTATQAYCGPGNGGTPDPPPDWE